MFSYLLVICAKELLVCDVLVFWLERLKNLNSKPWWIARAAKASLWGDVILRLVVLDFRSLKLAAEPPRTATRACSLIDWQRLSGSVFLDGIDWIMRNMPSRLAQFVACFFPSVDMNWWGGQIVPLTKMSSSDLSLFKISEYFVILPLHLLRNRPESKELRRSCHYHFLLPPVISSKTITISAIKTITPNMAVCCL